MEYKAIISKNLIRLELYSLNLIKYIVRIKPKQQDKLPILYIYPIAVSQYLK